MRQRGGPPTDPAYIAIRDRAAKLLPANTNKRIPSVNELDLSFAGKAADGKKVLTPTPGARRVTASTAPRSSVRISATSARNMASRRCSTTSSARARPFNWSYPDDADVEERHTGGRHDFRGKRRPHRRRDRARSEADDQAIGCRLPAADSRLIDARGIAEQSLAVAVQDLLEYLSSLKCRERVASKGFTCRDL